MTARLALGTYRTHDAPRAAEAAIGSGADWIDTAPNYRHGSAEHQLAPALAAHPQVRIATKVGFLTERRRAEALRAGALQRSDTRRTHSLHPGYVTWQAALSRATLGRVPDITFVHNPEHGSPELDALDARILNAFRALEQCCDQGLTTAYGVATWSALHDGTLTVDRLVELAHRAGGVGHRFRAIQLPLSLVHIGPLADALDGRGILAAAQAAGLDVHASAPLHAGELTGIVTAAVADQLLPGATPLQLILGAVASAPGVTRILLSASTDKHWSEALQAIPQQPLDRATRRRIIDAFST